MAMTGLASYTRLSTQYLSQNANDSSHVQTAKIHAKITSIPSFQRTKT